jgi:ABC-type transport system involved in cytochrome c biogenesis permease subunit
MMRSDRQLALSAAPADDRVIMGFLSRVSVVCFVASYATALLLGVLQLLLRRRGRGLWMLAATSAGLIAHTLYLVHRALTATGTPLSSPFDWDLLGAWGIVVVYVTLWFYQQSAALGLFLLPLALGLIGLSRFADRVPFAHSEAGQVWGAIHGIFNLLGLVAVFLGFTAGTLYLIQSYRLKHKLPPDQGLRLPSLEWLERVNSRAIVASVLTVGAGFVSGIILNAVLRYKKLDELPWSDPIVWRSALLFAWLLVAAIFSAVYRPARSGRKVAYLTVASFVFLAVSLGARVLLPSEHGREAERQNAEGRTQKTFEATTRLEVRI